MLSVKVPANLPELVKAAFNRARASGDVHFFPTQVTLVNVNSIPFQLRFSPALASKPQVPQPPAPSPDAEPSAKEGRPRQPQKKSFFDPFDNPPEAMLITPLDPAHNLVLNKFAIVPEHFILATRAFKEQTDLLERDDLEAAYACIEAYHNSSENDDSGSELYVFFNSGPASGSSQPHRHLQMLPVRRMREGLDGGDGGAWDVLAGQLLDPGVRRRVPFSTFAEPIGPGADLLGTYLRLYRRACAAVLGPTAAAAGASQSEGRPDGEKEARVEYNLAMTRDVMAVAPRVVEGTAVTAAAEDGTGRKEVGRLALNGTVLAGTALVKTQAEWDALRAEPEQLLEILGRIGVPTVPAPSPL
ncbi:histidine triad-like protein [Thermothelomyces thermophilus ATCC 42464]|uniref:Histidine triad-like protein n=1 Tax=Thermothelomyces thermophilus (strain ATCC 42464 / BCRC 31852 / DSM 1799) TaxID=573729 RepID=G2QCU0_THET4|nr:histidine triad-like protein [Thermothelomyces thermophilus ATCC 42464]AEO58211.1 histidine triad-like protein [Thermothelomyces thermophilus ATCC 42464]